MHERILLGMALALVFGTAMAQDEHEFSAWDQNDDGEISRDEFYGGIADAGIYDSWDANDDGDLTEEEFSAGLYDAWDADDDEILEEDEWDDTGEEGWFDF